MNQSVANTYEVREDGITKLTTQTIAPGQESSVEISQNAKGEARVVVKCYHADLAQAKANAMATYLELVSELSGQ